jgi:hypothetical protein
VYAVVELAGLEVDRPNHAAAYDGLGKVAELISGASPTVQAMSLVGLLGGGGRGGGL